MIIKWSRDNQIRDRWNETLPNLMLLFLSLTDEKTKVPRDKIPKLHSSLKKKQRDEKLGLITQNSVVL